MAVHLITYYMKETSHTHEHSSDCGCGHDHEHEHHDHEHGDACGCGHDHEHDHEHSDDCGCGDSHGDVDFDLVCKIESLGRWAQFTPNGFLVISDLTCDEILEELEKVTSPSDILFVSKVNPEDFACTIPPCEDWVRAAYK